MNKQQEIDALKKFIADLGPDTYLGIMFAAIMPEIIRDITSDFVPNPQKTINELRAQVEQYDALRKKMTERAADADKEAKRAAACLDQIKHALRKLQPDLDRMTQLCRELSR